MLMMYYAYEVRVRRSQLAAKVMLAGAIVAAAYFLRSFFATAALAAVTVIIFNPIHHRLTRALGGRTHLATGLTIFIAILIGIIPLVLFALASYYQAITFFRSIQKGNLTDPTTISTAVSGLVHQINDWTRGWPGGNNLQLSTDHVIHWFQSIGPSIGNGALNFLSRTSGSVLVFFADAIMYFVLLVYMFSHQTAILNWIKRTSPLDDTINTRYLSRMSAVGRSMVLGTFVVAISQGVLGAVFLTIAGVPYPVFWAVLLTLLSIIPLGGGILAIPIGIIQLFLGNIWQGIFIIATHFLIITNVDNVLRPLLVSKEASLSPVFTLLSALAGIRLFGPLGVVFGPIIMVIIVTTFEIYDQFAEGGIPLKSTRTTKKSL